MRKITINGKEYNIKYTLRALFIFETVTVKPFQLNTLLDTYLFFYCIILASNPHDPIDWDEFIDALDSDPQLFKAIDTLVGDSMKVDDILETDEKDENGVKKN